MIQIKNRKNKEDVVYSFENKEGWKSRVQYLLFGISYVQLVEMILESALERVGILENNRLAFRPCHI